MYYSHSLEDDQFNYFASFLNHAINGEIKYKEIVLPIIDEAHKLAIGTLTVYSVDRNNFPIIMHLIDNDLSFIKEINTENITEADYKHVLEILCRPREIAIS